MVPIMTTADVVVALAVPIVVVCLVSLIPEPARRRFMAIGVAGAGATYLNGGFGPWELVFCGVATWVAYRGLESYTWIGVAWLMHTAWDLAHHLWGNPILAFMPSSSAGCAITDALIAVWFLRGAPSVYGVFRHEGVVPAK
ncbi:MAG TPA: DUF6010 family protein [Candidatus Binatia bacterium]|nr:DUF6010 family protein [Candidatus Binatia bacterium]